MLLMGLFEDADPGGRGPTTNDDAASVSLTSALNPAPQQANPIASAHLPRDAESSGEKRLRATLSTPGSLVGPSLPNPAFHTPQTVPPESAIHVQPTPWQVGVEVLTRPVRVDRTLGGDPRAPKPINASVDQPVQRLAGIPDPPHGESAPPQVAMVLPPRHRPGVRPSSGKPPSSSFTHSPGESETPTPVNESQVGGLPGKGVETGQSVADPKPQLHTKGGIAPVKDEEWSMTAQKTELTVADSRTIIGDANKFPRLPSYLFPSGQALGLVPPAPQANASRGRPERSMAPTLPPPPEGSNIPASPLSAVSPPVQAPLAVAVPPATVIAQPETRIAETGGDALPQRMSNPRAMGTAPSERAARQADDSSVPRQGPGSARESQGDSYQRAAVRVSENQAETGELAFGGRLVPVATTEEPTRGDRTGLRPSVADKPSRQTGLSSLPGPPDPVGEKAVTAVEATGLKVSYREGGSADDTTPVEEEDAAPAERERKPAAARSADGDSATAAARTAAEPPRLAQESATSGADRPKGDPAPPPERASARVESEAPKTPAATRDIKLELNSGDQRVEVHLVEHGGDVHVSVRTPDTHLAGELRENLPDLSSRLEQTGLRPEAWHTTTPVRGEWHGQEHSAGTSANDANGQSRQDTRQRQGDPEPRQPKVFEEQPNRKEKGKEFAWFMSTLH